MFGVIVVITSCSKKDEPNQDDPPTEVKIAEHVRVLDAATLEGMLPVDTNTYELKFQTWPTGTTAPAAGEIVVGGVTDNSPYGILRKISSVEAEGSGYTCATETATLEEVILQGKINLQEAKLSSSMVKSIKLESGVKINPSKSPDLLGFDLSFEKELDDAGEAKVYGSLYFELGFNFSLDVSIGDVDLKASIDAIQSATVGLNATGNWTGKTIQIAEIEFLPWVIQVGPVPVVFVPKATLKVKADGGLCVDVETSASESFSRELGISYDDEWSLINEWEPAPTYDIQWPNLIGDAEFLLKCGPEVSLKLYGQAGPYFNLMAKSTLDAQMINENYNLDFILSLEANAGLDVTLLGFFEWNEDFPLFDKEITRLELDNEPVPQEIHITSPANGSSLIAGSTVPVIIMVNGTPADGVKVYVNNELKTTITTSPYSWNWEVPSLSGEYTIKAEADIGGETYNHTITLTAGISLWEELPTNGFKSGELISGISFSDPLNGYVAGPGHSSDWSNQWSYVLHTSDGGSSWTRCWEDNDGSDVFKDVLALGPDVVYACKGSEGLFLSQNSGLTWTSVISENYIILEADLIRTTSDGAIVIAWHDEIGVSLNGATFLESNYFNQIVIEPELIDHITDMEFGLGGTGFFVTEHGLIYQTTDNGLHWNQVTTNGLPHGDGAITFAIEVQESSKLWVSLLDITTQNYNNGHIYYSIDGGLNWQESTLPDYYSSGGVYDVMSIQDIRFFDPYNGYATGAFGTEFPGSAILETTDGGVSWSAIPMEYSEPHYQMNKLFFIDQDHGFTGGYSLEEHYIPLFFEPKASIFRYNLN